MRFARSTHDNVSIFVIPNLDKFTNLEPVYELSLSRKTVPMVVLSRTAIVLFVSSALSLDAAVTSFPLAGFPLMSLCLMEEERRMS